MIFGSMEFVQVKHIHQGKPAILSGEFSEDGGLFISINTQDPDNPDQISQDGGSILLSPVQVQILRQLIPFCKDPI